MLTVIFFVSLIEHYPNFNARLRACVRDLVGEEVEKRIDLGLAKDGSGVGGMCSLIPELQFCLSRLLNHPQLPFVHSKQPNKATKARHPMYISFCTTSIPQAQHPCNNCSPLPGPSYLDTAF